MNDAPRQIYSGQPQPKYYAKQSLEDLNDYLNNDFDYQIFNQLTTDETSFEGKYNGLFEPLDFFHRLYKSIVLIKENNSRPLFIIKLLKTQDLTDKYERTNNRKIKRRLAYSHSTARY